MIIVGSSVRLSPSDLSAFLSCRHRTGLDLAVALGELSRPVRADDPLVRALRERGEKHEAAYVESLRREGLRVVEIATGQGTDARVSDTLAAMRAGADVIVQAALTDGTWLGYADVLQRVEVVSRLGAWSYEPYDTKLARETKGGTVLQLGVYVDLLETVQGVAPERFWVVAPGDEATPFAVTGYRYDDVAAYVRLVKRQLHETLALGAGRIQAEHYPEPVEHCEVCRWTDRCERRRRADDHLSFIAGIGRVHRDEFVQHEVTTLATAATLPVPIAFDPARGSRETYGRFAHQARVQDEQRTTKAPVYELLDVIAGEGLTRLPAPSPGDVFLDLEGAAFARDGGREYLFGAWMRPAGGTTGPLEYTGLWAHTDAEERAAFEQTMDRLAAACAADPGAHIYHFTSYEPAALKRLMGRYATRADGLDGLLRGERFVDLHAIVRQSLRAGVERYSIKELEDFYGFVRDAALREVVFARQVVELALEGQAATAIPDEARALVETYNRDDCRSTEALRDWLERLRVERAGGGPELPRPIAKASEASEAVGELEARQEAARARLLQGLVPGAVQPDHPDHWRWLLAYLLDWHRREEKSAWWEYYRLRDLAESDLFDEPQALAGLELLTRVEQLTHAATKKPSGAINRYRYPPQDVELSGRCDLEVPGGGRLGTLVAHDRTARTVDIQKPKARAEQHPSAVFANEVFRSGVQQESLLRLVANVDDGTGCGYDLLRRRPPRLSGGSLAAHVGDSAVERATRFVMELDRTMLAIQGPPGSGKTYVGAQMIRALVRAGKRVGVTATSHKVIRNLLHAVRNQDQDARRVDAAHLAARLGHRINGDGEPGTNADDGITEFGDNEPALAALARGEVDVLGGTAWLWSRADAAGSVDVLFVDEAGQLSLANALAVSGAAGSLVLLGDPQQLEQPQKGTHPDGVGLSALEHVLGGAKTMPADRGLFLPETWRLHPRICAFTSELFYEDRLTSRTGLEGQRLDGAGPLDGAGLWWLPVVHDGNQNVSLQEVDVIERLVARVLDGRATWTDAKGTRPLAPDDILVVAPYNAQVNRLSERLSGRGVRVGTVDKFQGQEAPIVIYSMAASRPEDAPRGMEFLYSLNRLNVATSRAKGAVILVASPRLLEPSCRTPRQMQLANALCRYRELATEVVVPEGDGLASAAAVQAGPDEITPRPGYLPFEDVRGAV